MMAAEILNLLQAGIHSAVFATVGGQRLPQIRVIGLMLWDGDTLGYIGRHRAKNIPLIQFSLS